MRVLYSKKKASLIPNQKSIGK